MGLLVSLVMGSSLFATLPSDTVGDPHVRRWMAVIGGDWYSAVGVTRTGDASQWLAHSFAGLGLSLGPEPDAYATAWSPVGHVPLADGAIGLSADGTRYLIGERAYGYGTVQIMDAATGESVFSAPDEAAGVVGWWAIWPWLAASGDAAVFLFTGSAPAAPDGLIQAFDGTVIWEEGANGLRALGPAGAAPFGASDALDVLVLRQPNNVLSVNDREGTWLAQLCAAAPTGHCEFGGMSADGRFLVALDNVSLPPSRRLLDLQSGVQTTLPSHGDHSGRVAFDHAGTRMLYSRAAEDDYEIVVRRMEDGWEWVLDTRAGSTFPTRYYPAGFAPGHIAVLNSEFGATFIDTQVISADGFDYPDFPQGTPAAETR